MAKPEGFSKPASERRREWTKAWIKHAMDSIPKGARDEYEPAVYEQVNKQLAIMDPDDEDDVVRGVIDGAVKKILKDWTGRKTPSARSGRGGTACRGG